MWSLNREGSSWSCLSRKRISIIFLILWILGLGAAQEIHRVDPLALLSGTLRTFQRAGCDDDLVTLKCPHGTSISIQVAQYGKSGGSARALCPSRSPPPPVPATSHDIIMATDGTPNASAASCLWPDALQTKWQQVEQGTWGRYSLLQTVVEACQKKRQCKFQTSPKAFGGDPCPGLRKFVEVAYKCRPYEFRSKVACENDVIHLKCNPNSRIAVYSASYGRTEYESIQCPQPQGVQEETCLVSYATETVMQICHGKRRCTLSADAATFGNPCRPQSRMYLKVVYTCVPRKVLKDRYDGPPEDDEPPMSESLDEDDDFYDEDQFFRESAAIPPAPNLSPGHAGGGGSGQAGQIAGQAAGQGDGPDGTGPGLGGGMGGGLGGGMGGGMGGMGGMVTTGRPPHARRKNIAQALHYKSGQRNFRTSENRNGKYQQTPPSGGQKNALTATVEWPKECPNVTSINSGKSDTIGYINDWLRTYAFISQNQERFYLYLILAVTGGVLLCLAVVITRLLVSRRKRRGGSGSGGKSPSSTIDHTLPNGFADDASDCDIDLTTLNHTNVNSDQVMGSTLTDVIGATDCVDRKPMMYAQPPPMGATTIMSYGGGLTSTPPPAAATIAYTQIPGVTYGPPGSLAVVHSAGHTLRRGQTRTMMPGGPGLVLQQTHHVPVSSHLSSPHSDCTDGAPRSLQRAAGNAQYYYG